MLNDRKIRILEAIINDYIATAEPVGSRTIAKKYDLGVSSATIRNEMSDLEEMGLIVQPHTSAGRIPSDKGYRLYVDTLMRGQELTEEQVHFLKNVVDTNVGHIEYLMEQTAKALSLLTNYTTIITEPKSDKFNIKHIQLVPIDEKSVVVVLVTENKAVKNHFIRTSNVPDIDELNRMSAVINRIIKNYSLSNMEDIAASLINQFPEYGELVRRVIKAIIATAKENENVNFYTSGVNNILGFPEFSDVEKAKNIFQALEEKDMLITLMDNKSSGDKVHIVIGGENNTDKLKNCSIVRAKYKFGNSYGSIGIIGPTRMNYSQTVAVLNAIVDNINNVLKGISDGNDNGG